MSVQSLSNQFNEAYVKACRTSDPEDWMNAALIGRQLVDNMGEIRVIDDNYDEVLSNDN